MNKTKIYFIAYLLLLLGGFICMETKAQEPVQAKPANEFLNSIGVNSAIYRRGENLNSTIQCAQYLGFRWIRTDENLNTSAKENDIKRLYQEAGVKVSTSLGSGGSNISNLIAGSKRIAALGALLAIEGNNEPNNWGITYEGVAGGRSNTWLPVAKLHRDLYTAVKADAVLKDYPVWTTTETGAQTDNVGLQFLTIPEGSGVTLMPVGTTYADALNCHNYFAHSGWPAPQDNQTWLSSEPTDKGKGDHLYGNFGLTWSKKYAGYTNEQLKVLPKVTTETGITIEGVVTEEIQGLMYLSCYLAQFGQGWSHTAMYIMRDRSDEDGNQSFGFYDRNYKPRLAAHYLHNMTTILDDQESAATPGSLSYEIPSQPAAVHDLLLQKNDGTMMLIVWGEKYRTANTPANIQVNFGETYNEIRIYNPAQYSSTNADLGTTPIQTLTNVNSVSLSMTNHPYILEIASTIPTLPVAGNTYRITNAAGTHAITAVPDGEAGAKTPLQTIITNENAQKFVFEDAGDGLFYIYNDEIEQYLVAGENNTFSETATSKFAVEHRDDNAEITVSIVVAGTETRFTAYSSDGWVNTKNFDEPNRYADFKLVRVAPVTPPTPPPTPSDVIIAGKKYIITNAAGSHAIKANPNSNDAGKTALESIADSNVMQEFTFIDAGDGLFYIYNEAANQYILGAHNNSFSAAPTTRFAIEQMEDNASECYSIILSGQESRFTAYSSDGWVNSKSFGEPGGYFDFKFVLVGGANGVKTLIATPYISVQGKEVIINSAQQPVFVYSINGALVKQTTESRFTLESGFYIVKTGNEVAKVVIR